MHGLGVAHELEMALCSVLQIGKNMFSRLFDNRGRQQHDGRVGLWLFTDYWSLAREQGEWLEVLQQRLEGRTTAGMVDCLLGAAVLDLPLRTKADRVWKLSTARATLPGGLQLYERFLCYPKPSSFNLFSKRAGMIEHHRVYELLDSKILESENGPEKLVKLGCEGREFWMQYDSFASEFENVLVMNCEENMHLAQVNMPPQQEPHKTLYYFLVKFEVETVLVMRCCFPQNRGQYTLTMYREIEKNKYEWDARVKGTHFSKAFGAGVYLFFAEGFHSRWDENGEMLVNKGWVGIQSSAPVLVKHGKWLEPSRIGYEDIKELFMPMYEEVSHEDHQSRKEPESRSKVRVTARDYQTLYMHESDESKNVRTEHRSPIRQLEESRNRNFSRKSRKKEPA